MVGVTNVFLMCSAYVLQVSIPLGMRNGLPVSVSLVARHGADHFLLNVVEELYQTLIDEATKTWSS